MTRLTYYEIPKEYFFRLHHVRPRFKCDIENVLFYMAHEISKIGERETKEFNQKLDDAISKYIGNVGKYPKTINNWRTEISSLFGFIVHIGKNSMPGRRALELAIDEDLVKFFKIFLYTFQYPGAHISSRSVIEQIEHGVHFKPAQYILSLLKYANEHEGPNAYITSKEACYCVFDDLRVTRDREGAEKTWARIEENRLHNIEYVSKSDVIRYAQDILDYMVLANLLKMRVGHRYYLNLSEIEAINAFINSSEWFSEYDAMIASRSASLSDVENCYAGWFDYVNKHIDDTDFTSDYATFIGDEEESSIKGTDKSKEKDEYLDEVVQHPERLSTKEVGDIGENLILTHECMRLKVGGRDDLVHLVKQIATKDAIGYDINSRELDHNMRCIEVKTSISTNPLKSSVLGEFHMTENEWNAASSLQNLYYVYRLAICKKSNTLIVLHNPVRLYKDDKIEMAIENGADITFDPSKIGTSETLLR